MNLNALNAAVIAGVMKATNPDVNMVSAPVMAKERGVQVATTTQDKAGVFEGYIKLTVVTDTRERSIAGTVFSDGKPRFIQIRGINVDAEIGEPLDLVDAGDAGADHDHLVMGFRLSRHAPLQNSS